MKRTQEILDLPIISISNGNDVGKVKSIIINADKGAIDYIVVDNGVQVLSANVISTDSILGVGEYALTIESEGVITDIAKIPAAIDLLQKNIQVRGTKVLTKKGRLIGEIGDIYVDENDHFKIIGLEYIADITQKRVRIIPRPSVITFGKNLLVVTDDVENTLLDRSNQLGTGEKPAEVEKKNLVVSEYESQPVEYVPPVPAVNVVAPGNAVAEADRVIGTEGKSFFKEMNTVVAEEPLIDYREVISATSEENLPATDEPSEEPVIEPVVESSIEVEPAVQEVPRVEAENNAAGLFEQRQRQYLNGRRATKTIMDNAGNVIISDGMLINDEIIDTAKNSGKLIELIMNNKA